MDNQSDIRHEIKNHLTALNGFAEILARLKSQEHAETLTTYTTKMKDRVRQITALVDSLKKEE